ncbi:protein jagunal [Anthonomus grandis grandis]|uniref:protein jagunal n=1 Tax=Anthonomus grandis grandis TaxID=2921223 RepID=UPI00216500AA|nr:protein jagunal [Anthonomus grandis grandis]XP_050314124.1 protein jagunal [Anthonomus grandis grandis]XP_050314126.1 protein jagunal [Anthonomus grandis grandis]
MPRNSDEEELVASDSNASVGTSPSVESTARPPSTVSSSTSRTSSRQSLTHRPGVRPSRTGVSAATGEDHAYREQVAAQYAMSVINKGRLRYCIFFHYFLTFAMLAKLTPCILDRFNWFILAIEELQVPEPFAWEWIWLSSFIVSVLALDATKRNNVNRMKQYIFAIGLLGIGPLLYAICYWMPEVLIYLTMSYDDPNYDYYEDYLADLEYWKGYPCGLLWFVFITMAMQIHVFAIYFGYNLMKAWRARGIPQE